MTIKDVFSLPVFLSVFLHAVLLACIILKFDFFKKEPEPYEPHYVTATLIDLEPKAKPAPQQPKEQVLDGKNNPDLKQVKQQKEQERQEAESQVQELKVQEQKQKEEAKAREEKIKLDKAKKEADEKAKAEQKKKADAEQKQKAELEKKKALEREAKEKQKALDAALQKEEQMLSNKVDDVNVNVKSYDQMIAERVEQNWSRPPSAVRGMITVLEIKMLPTGQVVGVRVVKSSGDPAFDRSAEQAVKKVDRFEEVKNIPPDIFERRYREFKFTFNPEDLRR